MKQLQPAKKELSLLASRSGEAENKKRIPRREEIVKR